MRKLLIKQKPVIYNRAGIFSILKLLSHFNYVSGENLPVLVYGKCCNAANRYCNIVVR